MHRHVADAAKEPDLIELRPGLVCLRFEVMKIYSALGAVRHLLETGTINPGDTLVDSSSGIYAHALALACHRYGLKCHIVGSTTVDRTLRVQLEILGATLERMPPSENLGLDQNRRVRRIEQILEDNPRYHWMRQYHDSVHYLGYHEVARQLDAAIPLGPLTIVGGVGTGASTGSIAEYLREQNRDTELVGVQPFGSVTFGAEHTSDPEMIIAGIGSSIEFRNVRHACYDRLHWVSYHHATAGAVDLLRTSGVFAGLSAGAAYLAALWEKNLDPSRTHVIIAADTGHRYVDAYAEHTGTNIADLQPNKAASTDEIALPWTVMDWCRGEHTDARDCG